MTTPGAPEIENARTYPDSQEAVWRRILKGSEDESLVVTASDSRNGVINAKREIKSPEGDTVFDWAECGWTSALERSLSQHVELNYVIRPGRNGTSVTVNGSFKELRRNIATHRERWVTCSSTGVLEQHMLDSLYFD